MPLEKRKLKDRRLDRMLATEEGTDPSKKADSSPSKWDSPSNKENPSRRTDKSHLKTPMPWMSMPQRPRQKPMGHSRSSRMKKESDFKPKEDVSAARSR